VQRGHHLQLPAQLLVALVLDADLQQRSGVAASDRSLESHGQLSTGGVVALAGPGARGAAPWLAEPPAISRTDWSARRRRWASVILDERSFSASSITCRAASRRSSISMRRTS